MAAEVNDWGSRRLFLTGGTGSVGRTLIDHLASRYGSDAGLQVTVLTRDAPAFAARYPRQAGHPWLTLIEGKLDEISRLPVGTTDVIHAAADTHRASGHAQWIDQIVGGTRVLLDASASAGVQRFLLLSSGAVYGPQPATLSHIPEDYPGAPDPLLPGSTYGQAKRLAEQLCTVYLQEHRVPTVIARLFAFAGRHTPRDGRSAFGSLVRDALAAGDAPIRVLGDGSTVRSYLGGEDMAHALVTAWQAGTPGHAYNIGSAEPVAIAQLAHRVRDRLAPGRPVAVMGVPDDGQRSRYVPDVYRIAALGATARSDLNAIIDETAGPTGER